ncbi:uncharacterized protein LOC124342144 [Daphnia pulicaria]|uniref:uncharacterized protein LOC124342144 n=1 Tax=Daphnia pulicaria TaxID=35523 RepID=UPI001EEBF764|nr:uncharacterized protein LOC124342144 [Daphnia pulicaria]
MTATTPTTLRQMPFQIIIHMIKHQEIYPTRGVMQLVAVVPLSQFFIMNISVCFLQKIPTDILEPYPQTSLSQCWILSITEEGLNQRSAPSLSSRLIQLHCFSASYAASPATQLFVLHWRVGSLPLL